MKKSNILFGIFIFLILFGCKSIGTGINDVGGLLVDNIYENGRDIIRVYGRIMDNAYVYNKFVILRNNNSINLLVYSNPNYFNKNEDRNFYFVTHSVKGNRGDFYISVLIDSGIDRITFGNDMVLIWERKSDEVLEMREGLLELEYNTSMDNIIKGFGEPDGTIWDRDFIFQYNLKNYRKVILRIRTITSSDGRNDYSLIEVKEISETGEEKIIFQ